MLTETVDLINYITGYHALFQRVLNAQQKITLINNKPNIIRKSKNKYISLLDYKYHVIKNDPKRFEPAINAQLNDILSLSKYLGEIHSRIDLTNKAINENYGNRFEKILENDNFSLIEIQMVLHYIISFVPFLRFMEKVYMYDNDLTCNICGEIIKDEHNFSTENLFVNNDKYKLKISAKTTKIPVEKQSIFNSVYMELYNIDIVRDFGKKIHNTFTISSVEDTVVYNKEDYILLWEIFHDTVIELYKLLRDIKASIVAKYVYSTDFLSKEFICQTYTSLLDDIIEGSFNKVWISGKEILNPEEILEIFVLEKTGW